MAEPNMPGPESEGTDAETYAQRIQRRKAIQDRRMAETVTDRGLVIVHTGAGKGKTTAALGMVLRSLGHGYRVASVRMVPTLISPCPPPAISAHRFAIARASTARRERSRRRLSTRWVRSTSS